MSLAFTCLNLRKETITLFTPPSRVIIIGWISLKFLTISMYSNEVWGLIEETEKIKPIGCKWVYKRNRWVGGKIETHKARLVAKSFS